MPPYAARFNETGFRLKCYFRQEEGSTTSDSAGQSPAAKTPTLRGFRLCTKMSVAFEVPDWGER